MTEPFPLRGLSVQVQPSLRPSRRASFSTDMVQAQTKICSDFFQLIVLVASDKIVSEPFRGLLVVDLPGQVSRVEIIYLTGPASPTRILTCSSVHGLGAGLFLARANPDHGRKSDMCCNAVF